MCLLLPAFSPLLMPCGRRAVRVSFSSVLSLTAAMCGSREALMDKVYPEALASDYLWYSYGDGMIAL